ncbi:unnamed protein product [Closterium sp. NIES-65]|nr:unnamed protein product [Closterium sp. NIES-65]
MKCGLVGSDAPPNTPKYPPYPTYFHTYTSLPHAYILASSFVSPLLSPCPLPPFSPPFLSPPSLPPFSPPLLSPPSLPPFSPPLLSPPSLPPFSPPLHNLPRQESYPSCPLYPPFPSSSLPFLPSPPYPSSCLTPLPSLRPPLPALSLLPTLLHLPTPPPFPAPSSLQRHIQQQLHGALPLRHAICTTLEPPVHTHACLPLLHALSLLRALLRAHRNLASLHVLIAGSVTSLTISSLELCLLPSSPCLR